MSNPEFIIPTCNKGTTHNNQQILMICLEKQCQTKRLCCGTCIDQLHQMHDLISIPKFESMIIDNIFINTLNQKKLDILSQLRSYQKNIYQKINQYRLNFCSQLSKIQQNLNHYFCRIYGTFELQENNNLQIQKFQKNLSNQSVCKYLQKISNMKNMKFSSVENTKKSIIDMNNVFIKIMDQANKNINIGIKDINKAIDRIKIGLGSQGKPTIQKFSMNDHANGLDILLDGTSVQRISGSGGYPIAIVEEKLTPTNNSVSFVITQQPGSHGIWIGICYNFSNCYGLNKGTYAIDQVGASHSSAYSWSHHDPQYNSKPKVGFTFKIGDAINIEIDFDKSQVLFKKGAQCFKQPILLNQGDFYAFAGPTHQGDKINIVF